MALKIKIKYFYKNLEKLNKISKGDWIDLRSAVDIHLAAGQTAFIPLGVGMILPDGYEAHIAPRSSTFKNWGILQTNSVGVVDNSYSGDNDQWMMAVYATRDTEIKKGDSNLPNNKESGKKMLNVTSNNGDINIEFLNK